MAFIHFCSMFRGRKVYGQSKTNVCPFCGKQAFSKNGQGVPVCKNHVKEELDDLRCICGSWLDIRESKYGVFFTCINCGSINFNKGLEMNGYPLKSIDDL